MWSYSLHPSPKIPSPIPMPLPAFLIWWIIIPPSELLKPEILTHFSPHSVHSSMSPSYVDSHKMNHIPPSLLLTSQFKAVSLLGYSNHIISYFPISLHSTVKVIFQRHKSECPTLFLEIFQSRIYAWKLLRVALPDITPIYISGLNDYLWLVLWRSHFSKNGLGTHSFSPKRSPNSPSSMPMAIRLQLFPKVLFGYQLL